MTGSLRQCGEQLSSLTGVASTPSSPPPHLNTNTQSTSWGARGAHGEISSGGCPLYMCLCTEIPSQQHVCECMSMCEGVCLLLWEIRQLPTTQSGAFAGGMGKERGGGEIFSLSLQLCCCRGMQGRWKTQRREGSPPAKQRDFMVAELLNQVLSISSEAF